MRRRIDGAPTPHVVGFLCFLFLAVPSVDSFMNMYGDLSEYINGGFRVYTGELPYVDFWCLHPPGEVYFPAMLYAVFGLNINAMLMAGVILSMAVGLLYFFIAKQVMQSHSWASLLAVVCYFNGMTFYRKFTYIHLCLFFLLFFTYVFVRKADRGKGSRQVIWLGILIGCAFWFRIFEVVPVAGAYFLTIVFSPGESRSSAPTRFKTMLIFSSGIGLMLLFLGIATYPFMVRMVQQVFHESLSHGVAERWPYFYVVGRYLAQAAEWFQRWSRAGELFGFFKGIYFLLKAIYAFVYFTVPVIVTGAFVWMAMHRRFSNRENRVMVFLLLWGLIAMARVLIKPGFWQLSYANTPFLMLLVFLLWRICEGDSAQETMTLRVMRPVLRATTAVLLMFAFIVAGYKLSHLIHPMHRVRGENGMICYRSEQKADQVAAVVRSIESHSAKDDFIFVSPWTAPPFYALTGRRNPTYYDSLIDLDRRPSVAIIEALCDDIEDKNTAVIVHSRETGLKNLHASGMYQVLNDFIESHYTLVETFGPYLVFTIAEKE